MGHLSITRVAIASVLALGASLASAQDVGSYQLPPAPRPSATAQGPVVPDVPPPRPATSATASPAPAPTSPPASPAPDAPRIVLPTVPRASASPARPAPSAAVVTPTGQPDPAPAILPLPSATSIATPSAFPPPPTLAQIHHQEGRSIWPWIALALALVGAAVGYVIFQRREKTTVTAPVFEAPVVRPDPLPETVPQAPVPAPALTVDLDAARMSATLFNATLAYRLSVSAGTAIDNLTVRGDMTAAHASRPSEEQLGSGDAPVLHRTGPLAAGEDVELAGEIRLPLSAIKPIQHGSAALFVPLVRLELEGMSDGQPVRLRAAFVVGLEDSGADQRLHPFRLDLGPRIYPYVGRRALPVPAFA